MSEEKNVAIKPAWEPANLIADKLKLNRRNVTNVISLLEDGATIPFIARYRKEQTGDMGPDMLREVATGLEELRSVETKLQNVYNAVSKMGKMTKDLETSLKFSTSILEVDSLYAPFKPGHKGTYAERARALGLEPLAMDVLSGKKVNLNLALNPKEKGLESIGDIEKGIKHIIADVVSKDKETMDKARDIYQRCNVIIESSKAKTKAAEETKTKKENGGKQKLQKFNSKKDESANKFEQYFDFRIPVKNAKPHQILALNRGEDLKALTIKIIIPEQAKTMFVNFALEKFLKKSCRPENSSMIRQAVIDAYDRLIEPMLCRQIRSDLTKNAEKASISVFSSNLKRLLLTPPVKRKTILGIDPGFKNGCKVAVISPIGHILDTGVIYLHDYKSNKKAEMNKVADLVHGHSCEIITIGNGVACRETEQIISNMIKQKQFKPQTVVYCIVDECGASIYSVSDEAKKELPDLDPTLRGAVSIARRLQDPLAELVKIEPKHLGVGMYQHDLNKTKLQTALSSVVEECVSFVGVDLNTCSECLLRSVAGLNATKAKNILEWRSKHGHFTNRQQLLNIKGLGKKGFEQCVGFIRITKHDGEVAAKSGVVSEVKAEDAAATRKRGKKRKAETSDEWNPLDATSVHPESYDLATCFASYIGVNLDDIGTDDFISKVKSKTSDENLRVFNEKNNAGFATVKLIADTLKQPLSYDFREGFDKPLFKQEVMSVSDLSTGVEITGRVTNVTHFGAFVDIGVGINGLIHTSKMGRNGTVGVGDHVEVLVESIDLDRKRIGLRLKALAQR